MSGTGVTSMRFVMIALVACLLVLLSVSTFAVATPTAERVAIVQVGIHSPPIAVVEPAFAPSVRSAADQGLKSDSIDLIAVAADTNSANVALVARQDYENSGVGSRHWRLCTRAGQTGRRMHYEMTANPYDRDLAPSRYARRL